MNTFKRTQARKANNCFIIIRQLKVVNYSLEGGIKLVQDFDENISKDEI